MEESNLTDKEYSPESVKKKAKIQTAFNIAFNEDQIRAIKRSFSKAAKDDPLLILKWNQDWLANANNLNTKLQVLAHLTTNGRVDKYGSEFIFHFQSYESMIDCRDSMLLAIPNAFHVSESALRVMNANYGINIPLIQLPIPMAQAWIIIKTAVLNSDYKEDVGFFKF